MASAIKRIISYFTDDYQKHVLRSETSYLKSLFKLYLISLTHKRIVAISLIEHIGDIIANEPVSREVRRIHPESVIIWFVRKPFKDLLLFNPAIDYVLPVYCLTSWIKVRRYWKFEAIYDLHFDGRSCNVCHKPLLKENVNKVVDHTNYFNFGGLLKAVCLHNNIKLNDSIPRVCIPPKILTRSRKYYPDGKFAVINCLSNESLKNWDQQKWHELVNTLIKDHMLHVVEVGNQNEINLESEYYHNLCGKLSLLESSAIIGKAVLFVGVDSGPAHMANAMGTPGIILLGEYYFGMKNYNPYSGLYGSLENCRMVYSPDYVKNIPVGEVCEKVRELLGN